MSPILLTFNPLRGNTDWRAVCGRTACTVLRGERLDQPAFPTSIVPLTRKRLSLMIGVVELGRIASRRGDDETAEPILSGTTAQIELSGRLVKGERCLGKFQILAVPVCFRSV